ncbi:hypothetical protein [Bradyrhizobium sp. NP1]|uniref:hypothetical protein n=1 Tax=Bradyrhizobium sp. NP1 TaxID=3049772 RepID=UPI0025A56FA3|nr:hypothetical protein [Bradyrhizobium sp. NP1]WJR74944.1 hypothetical protein QOU61_19135 [Bradyrhizobium sp. NP1]
MTMANSAFGAGVIVFMALGTAALAYRRGHSLLPWLTLGGLIPIVALPWLFLTKPKRQPGEQPPAGMLPLATISFLAVAGIIGIQVVSAPATIPACDNYFAQSDLKNVVANSPAGKAAGLSIVTLTDIKEVSKTPTEARCAATARMNNTSVVLMDYRFFIEAGQLLIEAHWH